MGAGVFGGRRRDVGDQLGHGFHPVMSRYDARPMNIRTLVFALSATAAACSNQPAADSTTATTPAPATASVEAKGPVMDSFAMPANLQSSPSGLQYSIDRAGTGAMPQRGQTVSVHYTGWLTN